MVDPEWRAAVEDSLHRECGVQGCAGREAIIDALRLVPESPASWCAWRRQHDNSPTRFFMTMLAVIEGSVLGITAPCAHPDGQLGDDETKLDAEVREIPRLRNRLVEVDVVRREGGVLGPGPRTEIVRRLGIGFRADYELVLTSDDKTNPSLAEEFDRVTQALLWRQLHAAGSLKP
jgi:hypothetical protein